MRSFLKYFLAAFLAFTVFTVVLIGCGGAVIMASLPKDESSLAPNSLLVLDLSQKFAEQKQENPFGGLLGDEKEDVPGLYDVVQMLHFAAKDTAIKGLYVKCNGNPNGWASSQEIRQAIIKFKQSGKFVLAYANYYTQKSYYVASAADKLYLNPQGGVEWMGLSMQTLFFKGAMDKLGIQAQVFYAGQFKSATEPFRATQMSEANKLQTGVWLEDVYQQLLQTTAAARGVDTAKLRLLANTAALETAQQVVDAKLVDELRYDDQVKDEIKRRLKLGKFDKMNWEPISHYAVHARYKPKGKAGKIAILYADGEIVDGKGDEGQVGGDEFRSTIRQVRLDKSIDAIVVRVNSPGGSALASEIMWRELAIAKKDKPVIVSMGDYAASGGYYMICHGDKIVANPLTLTGSIGVFAMIPNVENMLEDKLGITVDGVKTGPYADLPNVIRPMNEAEQKMMQRGVDQIYTTFKTRVANGRNKTMSAVDSVAQGRIWSGSRAKSIGLVDEWGGLHDAVLLAAKTAGLKDYKIVERPEPQNLLDMLKSNYKQYAKVDAAVAVSQTEAGQLLVKLAQLQTWIGHPQARLPFYTWE